VLQEDVDQWIQTFGVRYFNELTNMAQLTEEVGEVARIIAANNIINAIFMIASSLIAGAMLSAGLSIPDIFLWTGVANAAVTLAIFMAEPSYLHRFAAWLRGV
jgi:hypothetical protein